MTTDLHSYGAPYALDALDADERTRFEAHLEHCADCRAELPGFLETANRLGEAAGEAPPAELKARLMASISQTAQERPVVTSFASRSRLRQLLPRMALAAAAVLTALSIGGYITEHNQSADLEAERAAVMTVMASNDAAFTKAALRDGGTVKMVTSKSSDKAVVVTADLPELDDARVYQLWTIIGDSPTSAGIVKAGSAMALMAGVKAVDAVALTIEPEGGSKLPTSKPIATMTSA